LGNAVLDEGWRNRFMIMTWSSLGFRAFSDWTIKIVGYKEAFSSWVRYTGDELRKKAHHFG
jgi:hypothetical protein